MALISIVVPTYNRTALLTERCLPSVFSQSFRSWECLVVGDGTEPETVEAMARITDPRVKFWNLPRTELPDDPAQHWALAGLAPITFGLDQATGEYVCILCDDDELLPYTLSALYQTALSYRADLVACRSITDDGAIYGQRAHHFDIPQGSYILRRSLGYRPDPQCVERFRTWDGDFMERILAGGHRIVLYPEIGHKFHQAHANMEWLAAWR